MSADPPENETTDVATDPAASASAQDVPESTDRPEEQEIGDDEEEEEEEEPKLKYAKLTGSLTSVYRNGDSTSSSLAAGDKMVLGTHNGNIHVLSLPGLAPLRTYHAHQATVTSVSISPVPPPPTMVKSEEKGSSKGLLSVLSPAVIAKAPSAQKGSKSLQNALARTPNNLIYIATSSQDGHVCVSSLVDPNDVQLRNFARPVQAVALSPDYKDDRTYLSGGLAGELIMTVGGKAGVSENANTNSAAAAASGWLGSIGLGGNIGKDTVLHSGEGSISTIKWSLTGKWVVWVNEEGVKIMRSHLRLGSENSEDAWKRIAHAAKPNRKSWQDMAGVWKARIEWIDDRKLETDEDIADANGAPHEMNGTVKSAGPGKASKQPEKLVVGWGDIAWVLHVQEGGLGVAGKKAGQKQVGSANVVYKLQFRDCIVSGVTLYTPSLLAILAYRTRDDDDRPINGTNEDSPKRGRHHKRTGLAPQLRLVHVATGEEIDVDELSISRFETLSAQDYHLGSLYIPPALPEKTTKERGALEAVWQVSGGVYAQRMFSSGASVLSRSDSGQEDLGRGSVRSPSSAQGIAPPPVRRPVDAHPYAAEPGLKLFIQSPFDCVLAVKRGLSDHLEFLLQNEQYEKAFQLVEKHPEVVDPSSGDDQLSRTGSQIGSPIRQGGSLADFFADDSSTNTAMALESSGSEREKRRIGDLWLQQLVSSNSWAEAGRAAGKTLGRSSRWEHWVWTFAQAGHIDDIAPHIPSTSSRPSLPSGVYELVLKHYIDVDRSRVRQLMEVWDPNLYNVGTVIIAIENRLDVGDVTEETSEDGVQGRDWRILVDALAKLYLSSGRSRDALRCYIRAQNADAAMTLIKEEKLLDAVSDDIVRLLTLKVSTDMLRSPNVKELEEASSEAIALLIDEAVRGTVPTSSVIKQLEAKGKRYEPFIYLYLRALWGTSQEEQSARRGRFDPSINEMHALVEDYADLAVQIFAEYDHEMLMIFLRASSLYKYDRAADICRDHHYIQELVYILSKMGQHKEALTLIIDELGDVSQAIALAKETPDLWDDLLDYSMNKPSFIRGLLEEVGTAIDPINLVRRIPEGLEIEGLKQGIQKMIREHEIQHSISEGVAHVFRGEVIAGMDVLRAGQRKAVRFEVQHHAGDVEHVDVSVTDTPSTVTEGKETLLAVPDDAPRKASSQGPRPGHCVGCGECFSEHERETLVGFACSHVYHISCLLRATPDMNDEDKIKRILVQLGNGIDGGDDDGSAASSGAVRSVGAKVAHAHIIKNVLDGGCRYCRDRDAS